MASRRAGSPLAGEYRWLTGSCAAATAASTTYCGVGKSGSPAPNPMTGRPAALSALALASTARVADSAIAASRADTRFGDGVLGVLVFSVTGIWWHVGGSESREVRPANVAATRVTTCRVRPRARRRVHSFPGG